MFRRSLWLNVKVPNYCLIVPAETKLIRSINPFLLHFINASLNPSFSFNIVTWFGSLSVSNRNTIIRDSKICRKIVGQEQESLMTISNKRSKRKDYRHTHSAQPLQFVTLNVDSDHYHSGKREFSINLNSTTKHLS